MFRSAQPGMLPDDGEVSVAGVRLPRGSRLDGDSGSAAPVAWILDEPLADDATGPLVRELVGVFPQSGLWPLVVPAWSADGFDYLSEPLPADVRGVEEILRDLDESARSVDEEHEVDQDAPPAFTGLADAAPGADLTAEQLHVDGSARIALVPVARPADVLQAVGWDGAVNYDIDGAALSAVLRSWEDRFGAVVIGVDGATLFVQAARRPTEPEQLVRLAGEHYAFCPDNIDQGSPWPDYLTKVAEQPMWRFWWD